MIKIGITGGIGSGKSYVSHLLEEAGIPVYDTDTEAKKLTLSHPRIREGLLVLLGEDVYKADGSLNKPVLASYLFASTENAGRVNRIIHPCVYEDFQQWADRQAASGTEVVAMESAILFESGFHTAVDYVVMVYAPLELRITRAMQRDAATEAQIRARISAQMDDEASGRLCHFQRRKITVGYADCGVGRVACSQKNGPIVCVCHSCVVFLSLVIKLIIRDNMLKTILAISGKPGLYKLISQAKNMLIVETVSADKKRVPVYASDKVISLGDIAMYTDAEEVALGEVLESVKKKENGNVTSLDYKKASAEELHAFMAEVLPNYDRDRVHTSDIKKLIQWYNLLVSNGETDFVETEKAAE